MRGLLERRIDGGGIAITHAGDDVVRRLRQHLRRVGRDGRDRIGHRRQHLVIHRNRLASRLRDRARAGHHDCDGLSGEPNDFVRQQPANRECHRRSIGTLEHRQGRKRADVVGHKVGAGEDGFDTRHRQSGAGIDGGNAGMRMGRAQHHQPKRIRMDLVIDITAAAGDKPVVLDALDRLAGTKSHVLGQKIHSHVPLVSKACPRQAAPALSQAELAFRYAEGGPFTGQWYTGFCGPGTRCNE